MKRVLLLTVLFLIGCAAQTEKGDVVLSKDEQAIRQYFERWVRATKEGELQLARSLIADDAVFLVPGADRMDKENFAAAATASDPNTEFQLDCSIQEIQVIGDYAWLWTKISLAMTDKRSSDRSFIAGHALSILKRQGEGWVVVREANTMLPVPQGE